MARVTVDDSLEYIPNRFELILVASKRARDLLMTGQDPKVAWNNDKATVVALREIAAGKIDRSILDVQPEMLAADAFDFGTDNAGNDVIKKTETITMFDDFDDDTDTITQTEELTLDEQALAAAFAALDNQVVDGDVSNEDADDDAEHPSEDHAA